MNHNYWPDAMVDRDVIHYAYGDRKNTIAKLCHATSGPESLVTSSGRSKALSAPNFFLR